MSMMVAALVAWLSSQDSLSPNHHQRVTSCISTCFFSPPQAGEQMGIPLTQQASNESRLSMSESVSEFFDAQEVLLSASSSENEVRTENGSRQTASGRERKRRKGRKCIDEGDGVARKSDKMLLRRHKLVSS